MYSRKAWGGNVDPFILVKFSKSETESDPLASLVIFEWSDEELIGKYAGDDAEVRSNRPRADLNLKNLPERINTDTLL